MPHVQSFGKQHKTYSIGLHCHRTSFHIQQFHIHVDNSGSKFGRRKSKLGYPIVYYCNTSPIIRRYYTNFAFFIIV